MAKTSMWGGPRKGAGRPESPYKTVTLRFRIKEIFAKEITHSVNLKIKELEKQLAKASSKK